MSYGYEPPKQDKPGSWAEVFALTRVAFSLLMPFILAMMGLLIVFVAMLILFAQHPLLGLLPLIPVAIAIGYFYRRGRREHADEVDRIRGR